MKKIISLLLAAVMIASVLVAGFAATVHAETVEIGLSEVTGSSAADKTTIEFEEVCSGTDLLGDELFGEASSTDLIVSFDLGYEDAPEIPSRIVAPGSILSEIQVPAREGYRVTGWLRDGVDFDLITPITESLTLTAKWEKMSFMVIFDMSFEGIEKIRSKIVAYGESVTAPTAPDREGYEINGWYNDGEEYDLATPVVGSLELDAKWEIVNHKVDIIVDNTVSEEIIVHGQTVRLPQVPDKTGYDFAGWFIRSEDGSIDEKFDPAEPVKADMTIVAIWETAELTVRFNYSYDDVEIIGVEKVEYGNRAGEPRQPEREGYIVIGWMCDGAEFDFSTPITKDTDLYAIWANQVRSDAAEQSDTSSLPSMPDYPQTYTAPDHEVQAVIFDGAQSFETENVDLSDEAEEFDNGEYTGYSAQAVILDGDDEQFITDEQPDIDEEIHDDFLTYNAPVAKEDDTRVHAPSGNSAPHTGEHEGYAPNTGDYVNFVVIVLIMLICAGTMIGAVVVSIKKRNAEKQ